jgi:hypothetical protein
MEQSQQHSIQWISLAPPPPSSVEVEMVRTLEAIQAVEAYLKLTQVQEGLLQMLEALDGVD